MIYLNALEGSIDLMQDLEIEDTGDKNDINCNCISPLPASSQGMNNIQDADIVFELEC